MRGVTKKIYLSILTSVLVFVTMFATTYAWVGIFTYSTTGKIDINLKVEETKNDYYLKISPTGEIGSFSDSINLIDIQKQIMDNLNVYYGDVDTQNENAINKTFQDKVQLVPTTAKKGLDSKLHFEEMLDLHGNHGITGKSEKYYKFDIYLTVDTKEGINLDKSEISANVALLDLDKTLVGTKNTYNLINGNTIINNPNKPSSFDINKFPVLKKLPGSIVVDSASSARFALEIYEPIDINNKYINETPIDTIFYQGGTQIPTICSDGTYSLGGILPEEYNLAIQEANSLYHSDLKIPDEVKNREERELIEKNRKVYLRNNHPDAFLGVHNGVQTKMKITVYFWFEGWDADCLFAIDQKSVTLNLTLTSDVEDDKKENEE